MGGINAKLFLQRVKTETTSEKKQKNTHPDLMMSNVPMSDQDGGKRVKY